MRVGRPVGDAQFVAQRSVHPRRHVVHHLGRRVPDAQLAAQVGIEGFQKRFVEVLHRVRRPVVRRALRVTRPAKDGKERAPFHPVERGRGPFQHRLDVQRVHAGGRGELLEEQPHRRDRQLARVPPEVEGVGARRVLLMPEHPGRKEAIEQGLHQRGAEERFPLLGLKVETQSRFQLGADALQRGLVDGVALQTGARLAGVGSQHRGDFLGCAQRRLAAQGAQQIFEQGGRVAARQAAGVLRGLPEGGFVLG